MSSIPRVQITGLVLAGGEGRRMGGVDKGLEPLAGRPLVEHVMTRLEPQVETLIVSANRNRERYAAYGWPVVGDETEGFQGPLAGIAAGAAAVATPYLLTAPCDAPLLPPDLARRLAEALVRESAEVAIPFDGERRQPAFALLEQALLPALRTALAAGELGLGRFFAGRRLALADYADMPDAFHNLNTPEQRHRLEGQWRTPSAMEPNRSGAKP